jgi:hypothetical protein
MMDIQNNLRIHELTLQITLIKRKNPRISAGVCAGEGWC